MKKLKKYSVRSVAEWPATKEKPEEHLYEERVVLFEAESFDAAIAMAEVENAEYCKEMELRPLGLYQCFILDAEPNQYSEAFSLIRGSELTADEYLDHFFDTGTERQSAK